MLQSAIKQFRYYKHLADKAMGQINEKDFGIQLNPEDNSISIIISHMAGNMLSRWSNIFEEDGEKPWRNRDSEFEIWQRSTDELLTLWESGWALLFKTLENLKAEDLERIIYIRNEGLSVSDALIRQLCHYSYHCGQIVTKCKQLSESEWNSLSIPRKKSEEYNKKKFSQAKQQKHFLDDLLDKNI